jgi:hypothetical protein
MISRLESALAAYKRHLARTPEEKASRYKHLTDLIAYYQSQVEHFREVVSRKPPPNGGPVRRHYTR